MIIMNKLVEYENLAQLNKPFYEEYQALLIPFLEKGWLSLEFCGAKKR